MEKLDYSLMRMLRRLADLQTTLKRPPSMCVGFAMSREVPMRDPEDFMFTVVVVIVTILLLAVLPFIEVTNG